MALHLTKVAVGCSSLDILRERIASHAENAVARVHTRFKPKRAEELIGGSLYWIIASKLVARQEIIGFGETTDGRKCVIQLDPEVIPVRPQPRRVHQGWRYLEAGDAPPDLGGGEGDIAALPPAMAGELAGLGLI
jgi:hypothetical protein